MNAQIEYIGTLSGECPIWDSPLLDCGKFAIYQKDTIISFYNEDLSLYKEVKFNHKQNISPRKAPTATMGGYSDHIACIAKNVFTLDDKITFVRYSNTDQEFAVYDEDGNLVKNFNYSSLDDSYVVVQINKKYYFIISRYIYKNMQVVYTTEVYSLPGTGFVPTDDHSPSAPIRSTNSQKIMDRGQVYIINNDSKYAITGNSAL